MTLDVNTTITVAGTFLGGLGYCALLSNATSYYGTKKSIIYRANHFGSDAARYYIEMKREFYKSLTEKLLFGIGANLAIKRYKNKYFDSLIGKRE